MSAHEPTPGDVRELAEAVADVLAERGLVGGRVPRSGRILDAAEVSRMLGRDRSWVYEHAAELGAFRFGDGPRARIGFELEAVVQWKRDRQMRPTAADESRPRRRGNRAPQGAANLIPYEARGPAA